MKRIIALLTVCLLLAALCACGGGREARDIDLDALAEELLAAGIFTDTMTRAGDELPARIYGYEEGTVEKAVLYTGTGATAEEIFLAKAGGPEGVKALEAACDTRIERQKLSFQNYVPEELVKLDDAVRITAGDYVLLIVSGDAAAARAAAEGYIGS